MSEAHRSESSGSCSSLGVNSFVAAPHGGRGLTTDDQIHRIHQGVALSSDWAGLGGRGENLQPP